jgi:glycosyltransferase involved in cell wall biosynthesis
MKVVHVMTAAHGGAGIAAMRLHRALHGVDCESSVLCLSPDPRAADPRVEIFPRRFTRFWERGGAKLGLHIARSDRDAARHARLELAGIPFSEPCSDYDIASHPLVRSADVVHLHWVGGFLDWPTFFERIGKPVVWTLHDMNPFLGGFHYATDAKRASPEAQAYDRRLEEQKAGWLKGFDRLKVVCPSRWLAGLSSASAILGRYSHSVIRYCIDGSTYRPHPREVARDILDIPGGARVVVTVAERVADVRKGADLLNAALGRAGMRRRFYWAAIGDPSGLDGLSAHPLGTLADQRLMALAYSAADLFIMPSLEDNLPNVVIESHAVGTPVVGLPAGGIPEMVVDGRNGTLASAATPEALAAAIGRADDTHFDRTQIRTEALAVYDPGLIAKQYLQVYQSLVA